MLCAMLSQTAEDLVYSVFKKLHLGASDSDLIVQTNQKIIVPIIRGVSLCFHDLDLLVKCASAP